MMKQIKIDDSGIISAGIDEVLGYMDREPSVNVAALRERYTDALDDGSRAWVLRFLLDDTLNTIWKFEQTNP